MNDREDGSLFWFKVWVEVAAGAVLVLSLFSLFSLMRAGGWVAFVWMFLWAGWRMKSSSVRVSFSAVKQNRLFSLLAGLCLVSLLAGPHSFLDSYSYRIPQMLLWLQEGHPWPVPYVDFRINQMPHIWPFLSAVFFLPFGEKGLALPNFFSFLILFGVLKTFLESVCEDQAKTRWILLIFMASPLMVMQAASNDNVLTCIAFLAISARFALLRKPSTSTIAYSALSFALCCGIKPQYVTLAPLWLIWFFCGKNAPAKIFRWQVSVWLIPLVIICSPLPTFSVNYFLNGSISQPVVAGTSGDLHPEMNGVQERRIIPRLTHSFISLGSQMLALPVNPFAGKLTAEMRRIAEKNSFFKKFDFHRQRLRPLLIPEDASFGFFATIPFLVGAVLAVRRQCRKNAFLAVGSAVAMITAILLTTPGTLGRSFSGFFVLVLPFVFCGLAGISIRILKAWGWICLIVGVETVIINPACPLWRTKAIAEMIPQGKLKQQILDYKQYSIRHHSGRELVRSIPASEQRIGAILSSGLPSVELWKPYQLGRKVIFYSPMVSAEQLRNDKVHFLVIKHPDVISAEGELSPVFLQKIAGTVVAGRSYTSYMQFGAEPWFLIRCQ